MEFQFYKITNEQINHLIMESKWPMNSLSISFPYSYASKLVKLNWYDILFAIDNGFLSHQSAVEHAISELEKEENCDQNVLELVSLTPTELIQQQSINPFINKLASQIPEQVKKETKDKIMYILLSWLYEHKEQYLDSLKVVEIIYDDFGFPEIISSFVRYMPTDQPDSGSIEMNTERLLTNWKSFINRQQAKYSA